MSVGSPGRGHACEFTIVGQGPEGERVGAQSLHAFRGVHEDGEADEADQGSRDVVAVRTKPSSAIPHTRDSAMKTPPRAAVGGAETHIGCFDSAVVSLRGSATIPADCVGSAR